MKEINRFIAKSSFRLYLICDVSKLIKHKFIFDPQTLISLRLHISTHFLALNVFQVCNSKEILILVVPGYNTFSWITKFLAFDSVDFTILRYNLHLYLNFTFIFTLLLLLLYLKQSRCPAFHLFTF